MEHIIDLTLYLPQQEKPTASQALAPRQIIKLAADFLDAALSALLGIGIVIFIVALFTI